ncbi:sugar phosphate isomerase/epimerase [Gelidibacter algens]|uniref:Sugar phosphate isomerase/epimerase n=1 Tax=Gelidibacter algens TaxID=49280 RepID=A0A1A7R717_9FLAO|nr:sugar phosphate isomerase/epimerase family protein [Gelidibacter algens]OBX27264.1 xylose isomerase [Gelidibacter algens]RAJ22134.1 sugar phosphate isomerase/epimerase [Gelidibacter algens]
MTNKIFRTFCLTFLVTTLLVGCKETAAKSDQAQVMVGDKAPFFKLSLAQWSLHRAIQNNELDPMDFAEKAKEMGFEGIEYVSGLYTKKLESMGMEALLDSLKAESKAHGIENVLIMIDGEGDLAASDEKERNMAVENHKKWVDAAQFLGCHSIRVNLFGSNNEDEWTSNATKGLKQLAEYGKSKDINIIVENHGGFSSNAELLSSVIRNIDMDNCGTLPDFGNFCMKRESGGNWDGKCIDTYDNYKGIEEMMPYAKGVSAKSYDFDAEGNETTLDYPRLLKIVKDAGYTGFVGVEFEGSNVSEEKGIELTRNLLLKIGKDLSK